MGLHQEIGGYQLLEQIGYGGMATVYKAQDAGGNRVALKLLHPALADSAGRERLKREVAMLLRVKGSRVAQVLDAEIDGTDAFVVTELVDGITLEQDVSDNGVYDTDALADLAEELAGAIRSIHSAGVLHRDLKPSNVMMSDDGPVLIDFGIAQLHGDERLTQPGSLTQTLGYCDSRVVRGGQPDEEADWWALAAVLLFAATGRPPFGTGNPDLVLKRVLDGYADVAGLDDLVAQAFTAALAPYNRINIDTLIEVLRHPDKAVRLLPARRDDFTQIFPEEHTRTYETIPDLEPIVEQADSPHGTTDVFDTRGFADRSDSIDENSAPSFYYDRGREVDELMRARSDSNSATDFDDKDTSSDSEEVPAWALTPPKSWWFALLAGLTLSIYGSVWLGGAWVAYMLLLIIFSTRGIFSGELRERRKKHGGKYPHDKLGVIVRLPWAFMRAVLLSVASGLAGIIVFMPTFLLLRTSLADVPLIPNSSGEKLPLAYSVFVGVAFFVFLVISWILMTNKRGREGGRATVNALAPSVSYKIFWSSVFIIAAVIGMVITSSMDTISWFPLPDISSKIPWLFGV